MPLRIRISFTSNRLALAFARMAQRLTDNGFADDYLAQAIDSMKEHK